MKINVEFEGTKDLMEFVEFFYLKRENIKIETPKVKKEKKEVKEIPSLISHEEVEELIKTPIIKEAISSRKLDGQTQEDCHITYPKCPFPEKRHYHKNPSKKYIPVYTEKKEKFVGPVTIPNE